MAAIGAYLAARLLNVSLQQTASIVSPSTLGLGISIGTPTSLSMSELGTASGYTPQSVTFNSVAASGTIASNANAMTFGPFSSSQAVSGFIIKDTLSASVSNGNLGNLYYFGNLATARTPLVGDYLIVGVSALTVSLS